MKRVLTFSFLTALVLCGCQEREPDVLVPESRIFTATIEDDFNGGDTRTYLDGKGNIRWKKGDQVSIFAGSTVNEQYQVSDASDGKTAAEFSGISGPGFVAGIEIDNNVAFYPYTSTAAIAKDDGSFVISGITLPATQNYAAGSFGNGAFPMTAMTSTAADMNLKFKNVLGGLKLQLTGTATIASVSVTGKNGDILCGAAEVTVSYGNLPAITLTEASARTVTLDCGTGVQLNAETATSFVIALPPQTMDRGFIVVVTDTDGKQMKLSTSRSQTITRSSLLKMPAVNYVGVSVNPCPAGAVDLGLSVYWATRNLCKDGFVSSPEDYGDYYAWGETEPYYSSQDPSLIWKEGKTGYNWDSYEWCMGSNKTLTKYCTNSEYGFNGFTDSRTVLDPEDDAAHVNLGGSWRMPTDAEWTELRDNCTWTWTTQNDVNGRLATSLINGNSIFLPAAGNRRDTALSGVGTYGNYWSSSLYTDYPYYSYRVYFTKSGVYRYGSGNRYYGLSVRPVSE